MKLFAILALALTAAFSQTVKLTTQPLTASQSSEWQAAQDAVAAAETTVKNAQNNLQLARQKAASLQTVILLQAGSHTDPCIDGKRSFKRGQIDSGVLILHEGVEVCQPPKQGPAQQ